MSTFSCFAAALHLEDLAKVHIKLSGPSETLAYIGESKNLKRFFYNQRQIPYRVRNLNQNILTSIKFNYFFAPTHQLFIQIPKFRLQQEMVINKVEMLMPLSYLESLVAHCVGTEGTL